MTAVDVGSLIMAGTFGDAADPEQDWYEWELWLEDDVLILNVAQPEGGMYIVSGPLNVKQADRFGKALASGVGLLLHQALASDERDAP